jgi:heptosyltransferase-3
VAVNEIKSLEHAGLAPFFVRDGNLPLSWCNFFARQDLAISYLHDPEKIWEENLRACGIACFVRGPAHLEAGICGTEQLAQPLVTLGIVPTDLTPRLNISAEARTRAREKLKTKPRVALHPGSGSARKNWPIENWLALADHLIEKHAPFVVVGGEADRAQIARFCDRCENRELSFATDWPLRDLAALLADTIFIGHDSGISHLAAAAGANCTVLFGPSDPTVWAPCGANVRVLVAPNQDLNQLAIISVCAALDL